MSGIDDELDQVLAEVDGRADCRLLPPAGPVVVPVGLTMPPDLRRLHELCGGAILFENAPLTWRISGPNELVPASPRLLGAELAHRVGLEHPQDPTNGCYVIADGGGGGGADPLVVVDLHPSRAGRCYDAFWDSYGVAGSMPVVAVTIAELLRKLLATAGERADLPGPTHGDAYDGED